MGFIANFKGRNAFKNHLQGNQYIDKGEKEKAQEKHDAAMKLYKEAYDGGNRNPNILMAYGVLKMRYGLYEEARDLFLMCERMSGLEKKDKKQLRINYSVCQWRLGNLDKAIELMQEAARTGKTAVIYTILGYYLIEKALETNDFSEALSFNQEAYEYDEDDAGVLDNLGQLYYYMNEREKAYDYFSRAFRIKPSQVPTSYFIAKMNLENGDLEKAKQFAEKCLDGNFSALCSISREEAETLLENIKDRM